MAEKTAKHQLGDFGQSVLQALTVQNRGLTSLQLQRQLPGRPPKSLIEDSLASLEILGTVERVRGVYWQLRQAKQESGPALPRHDERMAATQQSAGRREAMDVPLPDRHAASRWSTFRRLCNYYAECLRIEASQHVDSYANREDERFVSLTGPLDLEPLDRGGRVAISYPNHWAPFVSRVRQLGVEASVFLGGPVWVHVGEDRDTHEKYRRIFPAFIMPVELEVHPQSLHILSLDRWEVNHGWLGGRLKKAEERRAFLDLMGLTQADRVISLEGLGAELLRYHKKWWQEVGSLARPSAAPPLVDVAKSGIYNRLVLVVQPKLKYSWRLVQELRQLSDDVTDEDLDQSALGHLFPHTPGHQPKSQTPSNDSEANLDTDTMPESPAMVEPLNIEQRIACVNALSAPVSVVGGPPGTGKSRVVGQVLADAAMRGRPALFASRNHQAIQAVVPRLNAITEPDPLVINLARRFGADDGSSGVSLLQAIRDILNQPKPADVGPQLAAVKRMLRRQLQETDTCQRQLEQIARLRRCLNDAMDNFSASSSRLEAADTERLWQLLSPTTARPACASAEVLSKCCAQLEAYIRPGTWWTKPWQMVRDWWFARREWVTIRAVLLSYTDLFGAAPPPDRIRPEDGLVQVRRWLPHAEAVDALLEVRRVRQEMGMLPDWYDLLTELPRRVNGTVKMSRQAIGLLARGLGAQATGADRQALQEIKAELTGAAFPLSSREEKRLNGLLRERLGTVLKHLPLWSAVNLSAGRDLPLAPALFDLLIIDEASQCDIASVIPLLYRSRRVTVVGDPMQLSHIVQMSKDTHQYIRTKFDLDAVSLSRFMHPQNSFYDLAASDAKTTAMVQLKDHHRSHPDIAEYCNSVFYREQLNVLTDLGRLKADTEGESTGRRRMGLVWSDIPGDAEPAAGGGAISRAQIGAIRAEVLRLRAANFTGTVGVVTPFRAQANRLRDAVMQSLGSEPPERWQFRVDTADGFQGGERDIMLFSLVGGATLPRGSLIFLAEQPNRFNVAVSRARAVLHVFGDLAWAKGCGVRHITALVAAHERQEASSGAAPEAYRTDLVGPVWEPRFGQALTDAELPVQPQYPILGRYYADFALLRDGCKIVIEVDGETWHRDDAGNRKADDFRRDLALTGAGWQVLRFWVYELREDMSACVAKVKAVWSQQLDR